MSNVAPADGGQGAAALAAPSPAAAPVAPSNPAPTDWTASLAEEERGWLQNKGWDTPDKAVRGYRELEKLRGVPADRLLKLPEKADDPEWSGVYAKLGRPEKPEEYGIDTGDKEYDARITETMHKHGVSKAAAQAIEAERTAILTAKNEAAQKAYEVADGQELEALKGEWGAGYDANVELGRRFAKQMGLTPDELGRMNTALGSKGLLKFMANAGKSIGEHEFAGNSGSTRFGMTPEAAKSRMAELKADPEWSSKYLGGNADAKAEMARLVAYANGVHPG